MLGFLHKPINKHYKPYMSIYSNRPICWLEDQKDTNKDQKEANKYRIKKTHELCVFSLFNCNTHHQEKNVAHMVVILPLYSNPTLVGFFQAALPERPERPLPSPRALHLQWPSLSWSYRWRWRWLKHH